MAALLDTLRSFGEALPTRCWRGDTPASVWNAVDERGRVVEEVFRHLFGGGPCYDLDHYTDIDEQTAFSLIAATLQPPFLHMLGQIGRDEQFVPVDIKPPATTVAALKSALSFSGTSPRVICNANETGGLSQVDPASGDLLELLVIVYTPRKACALYWGEPID